MANGGGKVKTNKNNFIYIRIYISSTEKCSELGREMHTKYLWGNPKERVHFEDSVIDGVPQTRILRKN